MLVTNLPDPALAAVADAYDGRATIEMMFWLPEAEAALAHVEGR